jgi:excinuclease ABC subunit A
MKKPEVDYIKGICPAIAIEQKVSTHNPRSTVGTMTEIYDYLRLLYARIGVTISPISGKRVKKHSISDVVDFIMNQSEGLKVILSTPLQKNYPDRLLNQEFNYLLQKGFTRIIHKGSIIRIEDALEKEDLPLEKKIKSIKPDKIQILVDRFIVHKEDDELANRIADSVLSCFHESEGECIVAIDEQTFYFNNRFELDGKTFLIPTPQLFNFNNSYGACPKCEGYGRVMGIDEHKVIPDERKSIYEGAVACWSGEKSSRWLDRFIRNSHDSSFPIHRPYLDLNDEEKDLLWNGSTGVAGIYDFFSDLEKNLYKIQNRVLLARYRGKTTCPVCRGGRLREEATYVKVVEKSINELIALPIDELYDFFSQIDLSEHDQIIAKRILYEIKSRLRIMTEMGLGYLSLNRLAATLSGGETQRINLTRTLGSNLTNSLYILDEPSVGLHPKDTHRLVEVLKSLRDLRNTVIVVEHEEQVIRNTDYIIDMGPRAGIHGGEVVYQGPYKEFMDSQVNSLTRSYLTGEMQVSIEENKRNFSNKLLIKGARQHNLQNIDITIPLNALTVISGVSGSGKTTLVKHILYPALKKQLGEAYANAPGMHSELTGDWKVISIQSDHLCKGL